MPPASYAPSLEQAFARLCDAATGATDRPWACPLDDCDGLEHDGWPYRHARTAQRLPAGDWRIWLLLTGRGFGKTRAAAENLVDLIVASPTAGGVPTEWAVVGETFGDCRAVCVEGPSGLLRVLDRRNIIYTYDKSKWRIRLATGQIIHMLAADDANVGRGLNLSGIWCDEAASWRYLTASWTEGLAPALRIGDARAIISTTPKPLTLIKEWLGRRDGSVVITRGSTFDNAANLGPAALAELKAQYEGRRIGRQELYGEYLEDTPGALWQRALIDGNRRRPDQVPDLVRIVVAIDPAATSGEESDETGIVVAGKDHDGHHWVLADYSCRKTPDGWARMAVWAYHRHDADRIIAETNNGGDMVGTVIHNVEKVPYRAVTATRGKKIRAEPVAGLYEQGRVHHVGEMNELEDQLVSWTPDADFSPDRLDALVWAITALMSGSRLNDHMNPLLHQPAA